MLADWLLRNARLHGQPGGKGYAVLSSTVSSRMLESFAAVEGICWRETLTGFKWLGSEALQLELDGCVPPGLANLCFPQMARAHLTAGRRCRCRGAGTRSCWHLRKQLALH
jgi:hypothetical protein